MVSVPKLTMLTKVSSEHCHRSGRRHPWVRLRRLEHRHPWAWRACLVPQGQKAHLAPLVRSAQQERKVRSARLVSLARLVSWAPSVLLHQLASHHL